MIKIDVFNKDHIINKVIIKGHALYDDYGKDIVCASVSSIYICTVNAILRFGKDNINILDENDIRMRKTNIFKFEEIATLNQDIYENKASSGNLAVLIGASGL